MGLRKPILALAVAAGVAGCGGSSSSSPSSSPASTDLSTCTAPGTTDYTTGLPPKLSNLCLMVPSSGTVQPKQGVVAYELNTPLFSDYALKTRMLYVPAGGTVAYDDTNALDMPVGSIVAKTFAFAPDLRTPGTGTYLVETRVLVRTSSGWQGASYVWSADQKDADLTPGGDVTAITFIDPSGTTQHSNYLVPSLDECTRCHDNASDGSNHLLGPTVRNLNRTHDYGSGPENQITHLANLGILRGAPADPATAPRLPVWNDSTTGTLDQRARAWLEVNCAHCHNPNGLASPYGLDLYASVTNPISIGVCKDPVAAGPGAGGRPYDIIPGNPGNSILTYRLGSTTPGVEMPQIGRSVVQSESLQLITDWITEMPLPAGLNCH
ncbi:MAG TPA: SO2930 family diheme c-type cytochrome [Anaeromyxobacteraceae bacterium]|nr:SO2930 family diheme c-type cytochrome [Anaeromyxobacteraceae bacterium]